MSGHGLTDKQVTDENQRWRTRLTDLPKDFPKQFVPELIALASRSPCSRARRGAVVVNPLLLSLVGSGWNAPVTGTCSDALCYAPIQASSTIGRVPDIRSCSPVVEHAEQAAVRRAGFNARGAELIHLNTQVVDGERVPKISRTPRFPTCAVAAYVHGIAGVWLLHEQGWKRYPIEEFYRLSVGL